jgi:type I restriction enzyme S subunit
MNQDNELPLGWVSCLLGDILKLKNGYAFKSSEYQDEGIPIVRISDINDGIVDINKSKCILQNDDFENYTVDKGDILIAMSGATTGKFGIYNGDKKAYQNQRVGNLKLLSDTQINKKIIYYLLHSLKRKIEEDAYGGAQPNISGSKIEQLEIILPPLPEQHRIVTEIEKQFSRLDEAVSALKRSQANIKRYKASVLKSAVEGKLTYRWREQHPDIEPAEQLLERLLKERRAHWEAAEINKMQQSGKPPKDDKWKLKYKEPVKPDIALLPELPAGWMWTRLDTISSIKGGITIDRNKTASDFKSVPYLRVANVQRGYLDLSKIKEILAPEHKIKGLLLQKNDILFNEGGDLDKLGRGWIWEGQINNCIHQNHVFRARLFLPSIQAKLISWWGNSFGRNYFLIAGNQTTNLASINLTVLCGFPIPLPSIEEQTQIVAEVEKRLSIAEEVEQQINRNLKRAEHLRQAILKKAFSGKLVPQDSNESRNS